MTRTCYSVSLGDCKGKISGEHLISECMLPKMVKFYGTKFPNKEIPRENAKTKMLCEQHNAQLSVYDAEAYKLLKAMMYYREYNRLPIANQLSHIKKVFNINGHYIEKWLIKTTINYLSHIDGEYEAHALSWLEYLYRGKNLNNPHGLYGFKYGFYAGKINDGYIMIPLYGVNEMCNGLLFFINGFPFVLMNNYYHGIPVFCNWKVPQLGDEVSNLIFRLQNEINDRKILYRDAYLDMHDDGKLISSVRFNW